MSPKTAREESPRKTGLRRRAGRWIRLARLLRTAGLPIVSSALLLNVLLGLLPLAFIVLLGRVLFLVPQAADAAHWSELLTTLAIAVAVLVTQQIIAPFQTGIVEIVGRRVDEHCIARLIDASLTNAPVSVLESSEALDILADARAAYSRQARTPGDGAAALLPLVARYVQLLGAVLLVIVVISPVAGIVIGITALAIRFGVRGTLAKFSVIWNSLTGHRRKYAYLREVVIGAGAAKEIRLLGILPWLRAKLRVDTIAGLEPQWAGSRKLQFWPFIWLSAIGLMGGAVVLALIANTAASGQLDLFQLGVAVQAVLIPMRFGVYFPECDVQTQFGLQSFEAIERFEAIVAEETAKSTSASGDAAQREAPTFAGEIRFENVSFRYSPDSPWVLQDLNLTLTAGTSMAIVGLNGAGKTTLVKLLARLYEPTNGRITVDGVDLSTIDAASWQRQLALIFQDYVRYELSAADNIGFGAPSLIDDETAILAAAQRADAGELIANLPEQLGTVLSSQYPGGSDLSGGQWQRVALARALLAVANGASVLVLDEPTAQLDVRAEAAFFDRFLAKESGVAGVTSVVISHRFSTVRRADQIVVIEHGRVIEQGTHDELVALAGRYAELFELQASRFRTEVAS